MLVKKGSEIVAYLEDTSNIFGQAAALYIPQNESELIACLGDLVSKKIPLTITGGRTGTTAGCVPFEGVLVSLEAFSKITHLDIAEKTINLEAGVKLQDLENYLQNINLILRARPTEPLAFVGGVINTSASGVRGIAYGSIREYVKALRVLLTSGEILDIKRGVIFSDKRKFDFVLSGRRFNFSLPSYEMPKVKSQAGYFVKDDMDLIDLFIGSEGTLGIVIGCKMQLADEAAYLFDGLTFFNDEDDAFDFVAEVKQAKGEDFISPVALEFFDENSLTLLRKDYSFVPQAAAGVYFEQAAASQKGADRAIETWHGFLSRSKAMLSQSILADSKKEREKIFSFRHALPQRINEFLRLNKQVKVSSDIAVPGDSLRLMYEFYKNAGKESGIPYVNFGHIGESHLHFNFLPRNAGEYEKAKDYMFYFCERGVSLGGTISAEHGIGKLKKKYLRLMYNDEFIKQMAALKKYFDPHCLLGLDTIFDKELLRD